MRFEPFEPQQPHEPVGAIFAPKPSKDDYGATDLIKDLLTYLNTRLRLPETSDLPVGPYLDMLIDISEMETEYLQDFRETKNAVTLSDLDRHMLRVGEFPEYVKEWLENASDDSISNDTYYCIIYHIYNDPFMWSLFNERLPPKVLVSNMSESSVSSAPRGPLLPIYIVRARMGLALSSLGIQISANGFLTIYHAVSHICTQANDYKEDTFNELLQSIPVDQVNETPLHQLGLKLISVIVYEFVNQPRESTISYNEAVKAILDNSRWPHFLKYLSSPD